MLEFLDRARDRGVLEVAVALAGDEPALAARLNVDPGAVDAWRRFGVPAEFHPVLRDLELLRAA